MHPSEYNKKAADQLGADQLGALLQTGGVCPSKLGLDDTGVNPPNHSGSQPIKSELEAPNFVSHCCQIMGSGQIAIEGIGSKLNNSEL